MRNLLAACGKSVFVGMLTLALGVSAFGQATLRAAVDYDEDGSARVTSRPE